MAHLTLAGASDDGRRLRLVDEAGTEHTLEVTQAVRRAVTGNTRPGHLETPMDSALRPRDIQARIRAGESVESLAQSAQTTVEKIMVYAGPVLAEREHVAQRAMRSSLRRSGDGARTLGDAVAAHLSSLGVDPGTVDWDAWRRGDGRWTLIGGYTSTARQGIATFTFDAPGNYVTVEDDDARWLVGEAVDAAAGGSADVPATVRDDLSERRRRLAPVGADLPTGDDDDPAGAELGDDVLELVAEADAAAPVEEEPVPPASAPVRAPAVDVDDDQPQLDLGDPAPPPAAAETPGDEPPDAPDEHEPPRRPVQKKRGRASVPSWDEIMFGGGDR